MKKLVVLFLLMIPVKSFADANDEMKIQILNSQIESLTKERDEKYDKLKRCEKKTKGFKIAGLSTLIATGFGVYGNIKLAQRLSEGTSGGNNKSAAVIDTRSQAEKNDDSCAVLCEVGAAPPECNC